MSELNPKWYQVRLSFMGKFLLILFGVPALLFGFSRLIIFIIYLVYPPTSVLYNDRPGMKVKPIELSDNKILKIHGIAETAGRYAFTLPWSAIKKLPDAKDIQHHGFYDSNENEGMFLTEDTAMSSDQELESALRTQSGELNWSANPTKYDILFAALNTTPDDYTMWASQVKRERIQMALVIKSSSILFARKIQKIQFGEMRGFEFSDQEKFNSYELILFDQHDNALKITYFPMKDESESVTQEKINAIVASMHAVGGTEVKH